MLFDRREDCYKKERIYLNPEDNLNPLIEFYINLIQKIKINLNSNLRINLIQA